MKLKDESGFTLIELIVVMLVMSILSLALSAFISSLLVASGQANANAVLQTTAETALDQVNTDIMLSGRVDQTNRWPDPNGPGGTYGWQSSSQTLILAHIATDSSGNAIFVDSSDYITQKDDYIYYLSGNTLYRRILASGANGDTATTTCPPALATSSCPADTTIATGVTNWLVTYYNASNNVVSPSNARSVQLSITLSTTYAGHTVNASYVTRMVFRNA